MSASERRVLTNMFISTAMRDIMSEEYDTMRLKAFEKTGCLLTWLPNDEHDGKICPQGLRRSQFQVPKTAGTAQGDAIPEAIETVDAVILEEQIIIDKRDDNDELELENEEEIDN